MNDTSHNPLLRSGSLLFLALVILTLSGAFLFIYYDVEFKESYNSVQYLSTDTWLGAVVRSLHRRAAEFCMALTIYHALRGILSRRAGWIRRISGAGLLLFVIWQGVTGYLLPMDVRSQSVIETLSRSLFPWMGEGAATAYISNDVSTRTGVFLLASHVAPPVVALLLLGAHFHRLPKNLVFPPRLAAIAVCAGLLVGALAFPAASLAPADFSRGVGAVQYDWTLMFIVPVMDNVSPGVFWIGLAVALVAVVVIPLIWKSESGNVAVNKTHSLIAAIILALLAATWGGGMEKLSRAKPYGFPNGKIVGNG